MDQIVQHEQFSITFPIQGNDCSCYYTDRHMANGASNNGKELQQKCSPMASHYADTVNMVQRKLPCSVSDSIINVQNLIRAMINRGLEKLRRHCGACRIKGLRCWFDCTEKTESSQVPLTEVNCRDEIDSTPHNDLFSVLWKF